MDDEKFDLLQKTLEVVHQLANGKYLNLKDGFKIGMGEDFSIGFLMRDTNGRTYIGGLSTMTLAELAKIIQDEKIFPMPLLE